jgi:hypothetical protein
VQVIKACKWVLHFLWLVCFHEGFKQLAFCFVVEEETDTVGEAGCFWLDAAPAGGQVQGTLLCGTTNNAWSLEPPLITAFWLLAGGCSCAMSAKGRTVLDRSFLFQIRSFE